MSKDEINAAFEIIFAKIIAIDPSMKPHKIQFQAMFQEGYLTAMSFVVNDMKEVFEGK